MYTGPITYTFDELVEHKNSGKASSEALAAFYFEERAAEYAEYTNVLATAIFTDRPALVNKICKTAYFNRVVRQITPLGEQPEELRRTKAIGYSFFNLRAQLVIANIAERLGYSEFWSVDERRGHCILKQAVDFLYPYVKDMSTCPYKELYPDKQASKMARSLLAVAKRFPGEGYEEKAAAFDSPSFDFHLEPSL